MCLLWLPVPRLKKLPVPWQIMLVSALLLGVSAGLLELTAIAAVIALWVLARAAARPDSPAGIRRLAWFAVAALALALGLHAVPGFNNLLVVDGLRLGDNALPYTLYLNFDKALAGLIIIAYLHPRLESRRAWLQASRRALPILVLTIALVGGLALATHYVVLDPKLPVFLPYWLGANLLITCVAEEAFFRGLCQRRLASAFDGLRYGDWIALFIAALLFGMAHIGGGWHYVLLATTAGLGYGWVYQRTQSIEAAIVAHFLLNLAHLLFLTYPALA